MQCSSCGKEIPAGFAFCGYCGAPLFWTCPGCGHANRGETPVCDRCRAHLLERRKVVPAGERRFAAVLFADLAEFTRISEGLDPEQVTRLVNGCLDCMGQAVVRCGGQVNKYTGDGLVAVFGAPLSHENDPIRALRAAVAMQQEIGRLDLALPLPPLALHVGAACGPVVAARMGSRERKEYTVIGTAVNLASRLEALSDAGQILVGERLWHLTRHRFTFKPVPLEDEIELDGARVFELVGESAA